MKFYGGTVTGSLTVNGTQTINGTLTAQTLVVQTITSSISRITGSTQFGSSSINTHQFTGSVLVTGSQTITGTSTTTGTTNIGNATANSSLVFKTGGSTNYSGNITTDSNADILNINAGSATNYNSGSGINLIGTDRYGTKAGGQLTLYAGNSINNTAYGYIAMETSGSERMRITYAGNVGIGTTTPSDPFVVQTNINTQKNVTFQNINTTDSATRQGLYLIAGNRTLSFQTLHNDHNYIQGTNGANLYFQQTAGGTVNMTISASGNVGIGTTTPTSRLDLGSATGGPLLTITDGYVKHVTSGYVVGSQYYYGANLYGSIAASNTGFNFNTFNGVAMTIGNTSYSPYLKFRSGGGTTYGNYIVMDNTADFICLAAGTDAGYAYGPYMQLVGKDRYGANTAGWIDYAAGNASGNTGYGYHGFYTANTLRMAISWTGNIGTTVGGTNIYNPSDIRLKRNIVEVPYGLNEILNLKPSKFNWREKFSTSEENKDLLGFIAQEVQTIIPEAVESFGQDVYVKVDEVEYTVENPLRVNEKFIIPVLVKAIQEQQSQITALQAEVETLKNK
jgi:hypothetical protein